MRISLLSFSLALSVVACSGPKEDPDLDSDGDGITDVEEASLGTDPESADTDGDGIDDDVEIADGTDPTSEDSDGDGLLDGDEAELGLDPTSDDSDGDGVSDGVEIDNESDPLNPFSWPGAGIWPDFSADAETDGIEGASYAVGEVYPDFMGLDINGEEVHLYDFYGSVILLDFSAGWCGPCQAVAEDAEEVFEDLREDGFVSIHAMVDDTRGSGSAGNNFVNDWAEEYGITFPVLGEGDINDTSDAMYYDGLYEGYIPFMVLIDRNMVVSETITGGATARSLKNAAKDLL